MPPLPDCPAADWDEFPKLRFGDEFGLNIRVVYLWLALASQNCRLRIRIHRMHAHLVSVLPKTDLTQPFKALRP